MQDEPDISPNLDGSAESTEPPLPGIGKPSEVPTEDMRSATLARSGIEAAAKDSRAVRSRTLEGTNDKERPGRTIVQGQSNSSAATVVQEFFIPVWSQVRLTAREVMLVDHPAFARLADIYQLGQTYYIFRGATHKRWEHALGTLHAAELMASALQRNFEEAQVKGTPSHSGEWKRSSPLADYERSFVRLAALLHDIGHIAAGHTFEDELGILEKHDGDARLDYVLDKRIWKGKAEANTLRELIDALYAEDAEMAGLGMSASEVYLCLVSKDQASSGQSTAQFRLRVCRDIVGNTICADLLDYLHRDWLHIGKIRPFDDRLLDYLEIRESTLDSNDIRLVVNLRQGSEIRSDAVTAIFELLEARYQLGEVALFHRKKLTASAMLERLVAEVADVAGVEAWLEGQLDLLLEASDDEMIELLVKLGREKESTLSGYNLDRLQGALDLGRDLRYRKLHERVIAFRSYELPNSLPFVRTTLGGSRGASGRLTTCRSLELDFGLPPGSVVMYCPPRAPHAKIAQVQCLVNEQVDALSSLEQDSIDPAQTSGLLMAQQKRFEGLWRVQISASSEAISRLRTSNTYSDFERTIECLVLRAGHGSSTPDDTAREIAVKLTNNPLFHAYGKELVSAADSHNRSQSLVKYPSGSPILSTYWGGQQ